MSDKMTLAECPIGLFLSDSGNLCLKTEYSGNDGRIDAYIVESGEFFWGAQPQTIASQREQMVTPVENVTLHRRPVAFRIPDNDGWVILQNEEAAQIEAEHRGVEYQGLYIHDHEAAMTNADARCHECGAPEPAWDGRHAEPDSLRAEVGRLHTERMAVDRVVADQHTEIERLRDGLVAARRAAELALFVIRKQGIMPNSSWEAGFNKDMATADAAYEQTTDRCPTCGGHHNVGNPCSPRPAPDAT